MTMEYVLPKPEEVGAFYDKMNHLIAQCQGGSIHYGYWTGPDDNSSFEQASERFTDIMIEKLKPGSGDRVLDLGCGTGKPAIQLARATGAEVLGVSISMKDVETATALAEAEGIAGQVKFQYADATDLPFAPASFDAVLSMECLAHIADRTHALKQIARVLRPGGRVALTDFVHNSPYIDHDDVKHAIGEALAAMAAAPLAKMTDYPSFLEEAGLVTEEMTDVTKYTARSDHMFLESIREFARQHDDVPPELTRLISALTPPEGWEMNDSDDLIARVLVVVAHLP